MSILYCIDPFTNNVQDVRSIQIGTPTEATGSFIVKIRDGVKINGIPTTLNDLLTAKQAATVVNSGYDNIVVDNCLSATVSTASSNGVTIGTGVQHHSLFGVSTGTSDLVFNSTALTGSAPSNARLMIDLYGLTLSDPIDGICTVQYEELPTNSLTAYCTFNGTVPTSSSLPVNSSGVIDIPLAQQGTSFRVRFQNSSANRVWVGGWALLY